MPVVRETSFRVRCSLLLVVSEGFPGLSMPTRNVLTDACESCTIVAKVVTFGAVPAATKQTMRKSAHMPESRNKAVSCEKSACAEGARTFRGGQWVVTTFWRVCRLSHFLLCGCRHSVKCYNFFVNVTTLARNSRR